MSEMLLLLHPDGGTDALEALREEGGRVVQSYGSNVHIVQANPEIESTLADHEQVVGVYSDEVPVDEFAGLDAAASLAVRAWNMRHTDSFAQAKANRLGRGRSWGDPAFGGGI